MAGVKLRQIIQHVAEVEAAKTVDAHERNKILKELGLYIFEEAISVQLPVAYRYTFWQPWLKGYSSEFVGSYGPIKLYAWIDRKMKWEIPNIIFLSSVYPKTAEPLQRGLRR